MEVRFEKLPKSRGEITVELTPEEIKPYLDKTADKISREVKIPGFRPGHIPYEVLKKKVGEGAIYEEAFRTVVEDTLPKAIEQEKVEIIGQPGVNPEKLAPGNPLVYKAEFDLYPEVKLGDLRKLKAKKEEVSVTDEEVQKSLDDLRKLRAKEKVVNRAAKKDDRIKLDFDVLVDGVVIENGSYKQQTIDIGEGNFIPGFEDNLVGLKKADTKAFDLRFPKDYHEKHLANKEATFKLKVHDIYEVELPEMNDEWAKSLGMFKTFAEMRDAIRANLKREKEMKAKQKFERQLLEEAVEKSEFGELPENLITGETKRMIGELEHDITKQGGKFDEYLSAIKKKKEDLEKDFVPQAEKRIKSSLLLAELARKENITATMEEVAKEREAVKMVYKNQPELLKQLDTPEYERYMRNTITNQKVIAFLAGQTPNTSLQPK